MKSHRPPNPTSTRLTHKRSRRGSWLAQAVVTMAIMSILMTIASTSLFQMFRLESRMIERAFQTSTWLQVSREFRHDVHTALMIKQSEDATRLELLTTEGLVTWVANGEKIRRTTQSVELEDATEASAINRLPGEQYVFTDSVAQLSLTAGAAGTASLATLEVEPLPTPNGGIVPSKTVVATAGLDHRFLTPAARPEDQP